MKEKNQFLGLLILFLTMGIACSKEDSADNFKDKNEAIKSIFANGKTVQKFIYNESGKIAESQGFYSCNRYSYDENNRLIKQEVAVDPNVESSIQVEKNELMTSENSTFNGYFIFEYNEAGKLSTQRNYAKKNDQFELTSMIGFEYEGDKMIKRSLYNSDHVVTQFHTYEYDPRGNVIHEKYYSFLFSPGTEPKLMSEISFKHDDKNNPFIIYKDLGQPGLYTNPNNIVETHSVLNEDIPGIEKISTTQTTYQYNSKGFPIKVNEAEEYKYE